jgi:sulfate-transporting ATPase
MTEYLQLALLGLGAGAMYALLGSGIVLTYRASGVLNFAQGAIAMVGAYLFYELRFNDGWALAPALIVTVLACALLGAVMYQAVMRPLRDAAPVVRVIATLGVLSVLEAGAVLRYSSNVYLMNSQLPTSTFSIGGVTVPQDRMWLLVIAIVITAALFLSSKYTKFGLVSRAVAENETSTAAVGHSPHVIATVNWTIAAALAGVAGILIAPIAGLTVTSLIWLVVPALAAAIFGRLNSFPMTLLGALIIGVGESLLAQEELKVTGITDLVPLALILITMVVAGQRTQTRGVILERLPAVGSGLASGPALVVTAIVLVLLSLFLPAEWAIALGVSGMSAIIILSFVVVTGYAGQLSLAQMASAGLGALLAARLAVDMHVAFPVAIVIAAVCTGVVGIIFGLPSLRMRGPSLAIVTLALGVAVNSVIFSNTSIAGGQIGITLAPQSFFGLDINPVTQPRTFTIFVVCWLAVLAWLVGNLRRSRAGRRMLAVRSNERAAASLGISVGTVKLYAFAVASAIAGIGGVLMAFSATTLQVNTGYDSVASVSALTFAVVGGIGFLIGPFLGAQLYPGGLPGGVIANYIGGSSAQAWLVFIGGVLMLLVIVLQPDGMAGEVARTLKGKGARLARWRSQAPLLSESAQQAPDAEELAKGPQVLTVSDLSVSFGAVKALRSASLEVRRGEVQGLIGPNGSGKTTMLDAISGFVPASGTVALDGLDLSKAAPAKRARAGITRSFQSLDLFEEITVEENLRTASDKPGWDAYLSAWLPGRRRPLAPAAVRAVKALGLEDLLGRSPKDLSYGQRRLTAIARTLAAAPAFLLLDEPAAGLSDVQTADVAKLIVRLAREWNIGVLVVEHDMSLVMGSCDQITVLNFGEVIAQGEPADVRAHAGVRSAYLGDAFAVGEPESGPGDDLAQAEMEA